MRVDHAGKMTTMMNMPYMVAANMERAARESAYHYEDVDITSRKAVI